MSSIFNMAVPMHELSMQMLAAANPNGEMQAVLDTSPRLRYVWMSKDCGAVKLLLKEGKDSWSSNSERVKAACEAHPLFVSWTPVERDSVYAIAEFDVSKVEDATAIFSIADQAGEMAGVTRVTDEPFDLFDAAVEKIKTEGPPPAAEAFIKDLMGAMMSDHTVVKSPCPHCGAVLGAAFNPNDDRGPTEDGRSISVCKECGGFLRYGKGLVLEALPPEDFAAMPPEDQGEMLTLQAAALSTGNNKTNFDKHKTP